jgi:UDP-N-acetylglucosamine 2-epimerase (non-hydrolysing)
VRAGPLRVLLALGTRPEAVKLAPVHRALHSAGLRPVTVVTGQHGAVLDEVLHTLGVSPDHDLALHRPGQTLTDVTTGVLGGVAEILRTDRPDVVVVQGDTSSAFAAGLAAFYAGVPVAHLEAGLRSGDLANPWPEEGNRRLLGSIADLHLAPTALARENLLREGVTPDSVVVTGNTVVDALVAVLHTQPGYAEPRLRFLDEDPRRVVLVTAHRRESWGEGIRSIGDALLTLARRHPDVLLVMPVHPNPAVRAALPEALDVQPNVHLLDPVSYPDLARLLSRCSFVVTDSGGLQEEAPTLGRPVLVTRETTERTEAVLAGCARLVGTRSDVIVAEAQRLLTDPTAHAAMASVPSPFGDGRSADRVVQALLHRYAGEPRPGEFVPRAGRVPVPRVPASLAAAAGGRG